MQQVEALDPFWSCFHAVSCYQGGYALSPRNSHSNSGYWTILWLFLRFSKDISMSLDDGCQQMLEIRFLDWSWRSSSRRSGRLISCCVPWTNQRIYSLWVFSQVSHIGPSTLRLLQTGWFQEVERWKETAVRKASCFPFKAGRIQKHLGIAFSVFFSMF